MKEKLTQFEPQARSVARIIVGFLVSLHGFRNVFGVLQSRAGRAGAAPMALDAIGTAGGYIEMVGGILFLLGLLTIPVAAVLCLTTLAAYVAGPLSQPSQLPIRNGGEEAVLYAAVMVYYALMGGGEWSLDRFIGNKKLAPSAAS